jgi:hypothetical protein
MSDEFDGLFDSPLGAEATAEDATATSLDGANTEEILNDDMDESIQEPNAQEDSDHEQAESDPEPESKEIDWKAKYEEEAELRRKNQSYADSRYNELDKKINQMMQGQTQKKEAPPEKEYTKEELADLMYSDPEAAIKYVTSKNKPQQGNPANNQLQIDQAVQRGLHSDYDEVIASLEKVAAFRPEIIEKIQSSPNRALAAYEEGKKLQEQVKMTEDPEAFEKQLREKILKELEEDNRTKSKPNLRNVPSSPRTKSKVKKKDPLAGLFDSPLSKVASR